MASAVRVTTKTNQNLTPSQKELLRWNFRLGHIGIQHVQWLIHTERLKLQVNETSVDNCERPNFDAFEFGKGICLPNKVNTTKKNPMKDQELNKYHLLSGHMVSAYHYISRAPGRLYQKKVKSDISDMFQVGCVFIDHASGYVSIKHQVAINATENVKAKLTF